LPQPSVAVRVKLWVMPHSSPEAVPGVQTGVIEPSHASEAVMPRASTSAQVGAVVVQPRSIGSVGQPVNTGASVSAFQVYVTTQLPLPPQLPAAVSVKLWLRWQPFDMTSPGVHCRVTGLPQRVAVTSARASSQSGRLAGLQPRLIGAVGQLENIGPVEASVQV
jgi:hypothetical protein